MSGVVTWSRVFRVWAGALVLATAAFVYWQTFAKPDDPIPVEAPGDGNEMVVRLSDKVTMRLLLLPAGEFVMGSPQTEKGRGDDEGQRVVAISEPFYIGVTEVTQEQYEAVMGENPSTFKGKTRPVEEVSWEDACEFCRELSRRTGRTFRLPTEAEWEYACRAGTRTAYASGDDAADLKKAGWFCYDPAAVSATREVGQMEPNPWGLYDMHGNVWEWCSDWYAEKYDFTDAGRVDPKGPPGGRERILRGGSWSDEEAEVCRSAYRDGQPPDYSDDDIGFRIVCEK